MVRAGSGAFAEDGPGAARLKELPVKGQRVEAATETPVSASGCLVTAGEGDDREAPPNLKW